MSFNNFYHAKVILQKSSQLCEQYVKKIVFKDLATSIRVIKIVVIQIRLITRIKKMAWVFSDVENC